MERRVLGKGLDALIPKKATNISPREFVYLPLESIAPAQKQPRQQVNQQELLELAQSIKEKGFIQPIVVRKTDSGRYEIVAGERRYLAAKSLKLKEIPTIVKEVNAQDAFVLAIVKNLQRKDLNPIELCVLRISTYELLHRLELPYPIILKEAVNLAKTYGATDGYKYVNGVLDKAAKALRPHEKYG